MDEDLLKRNTDCVYFLASPLTCKKGAECEYRHNEITRLNPRDCWYWLLGDCLNPTCAFRHPPLDGQTGVPSEPTQSSVTANKTMVPCYFFFNGFCNKGDRCSFLHGPAPDDSFLTSKPVKNDNKGENKMLSGTKIGVASTPTEAHFDQSLTAPKALSNFKVTPKEELLQLSLPKSVEQQADCQEIPAFEYEEATVNRSESPYPDEEFVHDTSHLCTEQSPDEQANGHIEPEERWESSPGLSPGFDVLVHDESENLGYEDDSEYLPVLDGEHQELNEQYLGLEFKDQLEYETIQPEADDLYEQEMYDGYRCLDRDLAHANGRRVCARSREIFFDSILTRKRIWMSDMAACERDLDLRDHLRRRRENSGPLGSGFFRRHESSSLMVRNQERRQRHYMEQRVGRRLTSQVGFSSIGAVREVETLSIANKKRLFRNSQQHRPTRRQHYREKRAKRQFLASDVSRKPVFKQRRFNHESTAFSGPKSLAEIREEEKKAEEALKDPKPLSEIFKGKRTMDGDDNA